MIADLSYQQSRVFTAGLPVSKGGGGSRFRTWVAGRRTGKTFEIGTELLYRGLNSAEFRNKDKQPLLWYIAPTYRQAKDILWRDLKRRAAPYLAKRPNESELSMVLDTGAMIELRGASNPDYLRGPGIDFVAFDEFADIDPSAWTEVIRPALADRRGHAIFCGTPKGRNHFYELHNEAKNKPGWAAFSCRTIDGGLVPREELAESKRTMDARSYRQEYLASFESYAGLVYYAFEREKNTRESTIDATKPVHWALDFNVDPMTSVLAHINEFGYGRQQRIVEVFDEIVIPNSNVPEMCEAFGRKTKEIAKKYGMNVFVYADASGDARCVTGTTAIALVKQWFQRNPDYRVHYRIPNSNPSVADSVRTVNSMFCSLSKERRLFVHPKCRELIADFEQVEWTNTLGIEMDKRDSKRTHVSDALRYLVDYEFSINQGQGWRSQVLV